MRKQRIVRRSLGFTIIELIIVIIVLSILAYVATARWPDSDLIRLDAMATAVVDEIRLAQRHSIFLGQRYKFQILTSTTYRIATLTDSDITNYSLQSGMTFSSDTLPSDLVSFDGNGVPYTTSTTPGTPLNTTATITLRAGTSTKTISIFPTTGRVTQS